MNAHWSSAGLSSTLQRLLVGSSLSRAVALIEAVLSQAKPPVLAGTAVFLISGITWPDHTLKHTPTQARGQDDGQQQTGEGWEGGGAGPGLRQAAMREVDKSWAVSRSSSPRLLPAYPILVMKTKGRYPAVQLSEIGYC